MFPITNNLRERLKGPKRIALAKMLFKMLLLRFIYYARVFAKVQMQCNIRKIHNPDHILLRWTPPVQAGTWKHREVSGFISVRICSLSSARSGIWLRHSRGAAVTWFSLQFKRFQRLGMITAHGAISQYTTGLYLDCLSRSITGSGPNNIAVCSVWPRVSIYKDWRFLVKAGVTAHPKLSPSLYLSLPHPSVRCSERKRVGRESVGKDSERDKERWTSGL